MSIKTIIIFFITFWVWGTIDITWNKAKTTAEYIYSPTETIKS